MRFRTRAFLCCFLPFALLLAASFWLIQQRVLQTVRAGLRESLLEKHTAVAQVLANSDLQSSRFLKVVGEDAALKAGVQLLLTYPKNADARRTVEDQLHELCERMGFAMLVVSHPNGAPMAGWMRSGRQAGPLDTLHVDVNHSGLMLLDGVAYQMASLPIDQDGENLGTISVGEVFDFSQFRTPTVLLRNGQIVESRVDGAAQPEIEAAMRGCPGMAECDIQLRGVHYISLPMQNISLGDGYVLRSLQDLDSAVAPVQMMLRSVFLGVALIAVLVAMIVGAVSAGSIVRPLATVVRHLQAAERTGDLTEFRAGDSGVTEVRRLIESFNRAAAAVREGRENLTLAYVEFVQSLASALDARDPYTAGHSRRVSEMSSAAAREMGLPAEVVERIRVGALLHDIGKIGVPDDVLRKPGRLTPQEFELVQEHPIVGRRILEGVNGFSPYLAAVELHHENWDGTGYPHGQAGLETPVDARIIHVADAYDAMTTDRPYRRGMSHEEAIARIRDGAGTQFDPEVVRRFAAVEIEPREVVTEAHA
ncbi:MAG TPA: HD domain-containing phosphohydrolase [Bryobacteraceae bacterium]|nr:HD domain-containing phosphohydrolase [Bryobacteraceae bacterium]